MGKYEEAVVYLKEAPRLYPANANALLAREQLGESYRQLARKELYEERELRQRSELPGLSDEQRQALIESAAARHKARVGWLTEAVRVFQQMTDELAQRAAQKPLRPTEQELHRRAWFGIGECHLDNEELMDALRVFTELQAKHRRTLESCYCSLRVCSIATAMQLRKLPEKQVQDARNKAKESLAMVADDLKNMPADAEAFSRPGAFTREEWMRRLQATQQQLFAAPEGLPSPGYLP
jgi:tetratricopeptide (TPR) repeat protein